MNGRKQRQTVDPRSWFSTHDCGPIKDADRIILEENYFYPKIGGMCLHQNLEEESQGLESSRDYVSRESIACRLGPADSNAALKSAFFRHRQQITTKATIGARTKHDGLYKKRKIRVEVVLN